MLLGKRNVKLKLFDVCHNTLWHVSCVVITNNEEQVFIGNDTCRLIWTFGILYNVKYRPKQCKEEGKQSDINHIVLLLKSRHKIKCKVNDWLVVCWCKIFVFVVFVLWKLNSFVLLSCESWKVYFAFIIFYFILILTQINKKQFTTTTTTVTLLPNNINNKHDDEKQFILFFQRNKKRQVHANLAMNLNLKTNLLLLA